MSSHEAEELHREVDRIADRLAIEPGRPLLMTETWLKWLHRYRTKEEARRLEQLLVEIAPYHWDTDEHQLLLHEFELMNQLAEERATNDRVDRWPRELRDHEQEWREWKAWEKIHPKEWCDPRTPPPENTVFVTYHKGCLPRQLIVPILTSVIWVNRENSPVSGHFIRHIPQASVKERVFESPEIAFGESWSYMFEMPGVYAYSCIHRGEWSKCGEEALIVVLGAGEKLEDALLEHEQLKKVLPVIAA